MTETEPEEEPLVLAEDERVTHFAEDDNPEQLAGEDVEDNFDFDPEAELVDPEEEPDGEPGA